ncbi:MAG TPA: UDP-glucose/GDP-mannose dehydrogenase family protein [Clostridia bacterium]|nr:UDP-glucose/GDP-mannose dehydrogenase family protein [Clostridia bacterium]
MRISIIGTGYVGLVSGVCLASKGHDVICVDKLDSIVAKINKGEPPIYEEGLEPLLKETVTGKKLIATMDMAYAVSNSEVSIIAVGTPYVGDSIDLTYIKEAAAEIGAVLRNKKEYHVVCVKSTVVPTTTDSIVRKVLEQSSGKKAGEFGLVMNPEFLKEGEALEDFLKPDRIVIGAFDEKSFETFKKVYENCFDAPIIKVNPRTAEMIKYASNSLLATLISFSNEIAAISEEVGNIDSAEVLECVNLDKRISPRINRNLIKPGITRYIKSSRGFGGSCFPKDVKAIIAFSEDCGYTPKILKSAIEVNELQAMRMLGILKRELLELKDKNIAVLGLAFKANTDDVRESQSIKLVKELIREHARIKCHDPIAIENAKKELQNNPAVLMTDNYEEALKGADAAVIMTDWQSIVNIPLNRYAELMKNPLIVDGCRVLSKLDAESYGVRYVGIGLNKK